MVVSPIMLIHHRAKFTHSESGDMNIPANMARLTQIWDIRDCIYVLTSAIIIFSKTMDWFLYDRDPCHERVKEQFLQKLFLMRPIK